MRKSLRASGAREAGVRPHAPAAHLPSLRHEVRPCRIGPRYDGLRPVRLQEHHRENVRAERLLPGARIAFALALGAAGTVHAAAPDPEGRLRLQVTTMALSANQVLPLPLALGIQGVGERGWLGADAGVHADLATICDNASGGDGSCGLFVIAETGVRVRRPVTRGFAPYLAVRGQWLRMMRADSGSWAVAPRAGFSYDGDLAGFFFEAGASVVVGQGLDDWRLIGIDSRRVLPVIVAGARFRLRSF